MVLKILIEKGAKLARRNLDDIDRPQLVVCSVDHDLASRSMLIRPPLLGGVVANSRLIFVITTFEWS